MCSTGAKHFFLSEHHYLHVLYSLESPIDVLAPYFQNQSCDPFTPRGLPCSLGNYAPFSIKVTGVGDIQAGILFARNKNIRLALKNTGHE